MVAPDPPAGLRAIERYIACCADSIIRALAGVIIATGYDLLVIPQPGFIPLMSHINIWIVIAILLALFAVTRYLMHERETSLICANDPSAPACQR
jgi:hypothetical protein